MKRHRPIRGDPARAGHGSVGATNHVRDANGRITGTVTTDSNGTKTFRDGSGRTTGTATHYERYNDIPGCWRPHHRHSHSAKTLNLAAAEVPLLATHSRPSGPHRRAAEQGARNVTGEETAGCALLLPTPAHWSASGDALPGEFPGAISSRSGRALMKSTSSRRRAQGQSSCPKRSSRHLRSIFLVPRHRCSARGSSGRPRISLRQALAQVGLAQVGPASQVSASRRSARAKVWEKHTPGFLPRHALPGVPPPA